MKIEEYNDITVKRMKEKLSELDVTTESDDKQEVYDLYEETLKSHNEKTEEVKEEVEEVKDIKEEEVVAKEEVVEDVKEEYKPQETSVPSAPRMIEHNEMIQVKSVTHGGLTYVSPKTGMKYTWGDYGDVHFLEYGELLTMRSMFREFLEKPYLKIDDKEVVNTMHLQPVYDDMLTEEEVNEILYEMDWRDLEDTLDNLSIDNRDIVAEAAKIGVKEGKVNNTGVIRTLEEGLNVGLTYIITERDRASRNRNAR